MGLLARLAPLALRPLLPLLPGIARVGADLVGCSVAKPGIDAIEKYLVSRFTDQSNEELGALQRAAERAWKVLEIALAGPSLLDHWSRRGEDKALAAQLRAFLDGSPLLLPLGLDPKKALEELREARHAGLIPGVVEPQAIAHHTAELLRFIDRTCLPSHRLAPTVPPLPIART